MVRSLKNAIFIFLLLLIAIIMSWLIFNYYKPHPSAQKELVWVKAVKVEIQSLPQEIHSLGSIVARSVQITPELAGHVEQIFFTDGTFVKQGTVLVQLNDAVYKNKYASAKAKFIYSQHNFNRMSLLAKKGIIAKQAIDQAEADLKEKKAEADENEVMMNKLKLVAPFDGTVGKNKINLGDYVIIGQNIVSLTDTKHLRIEYTISEKYLPLIKLGQLVNIKTPAYADRKFKGRVTFISPTIDINNRSIDLYAELDNEDNLLKSGMFVDVVQLLGKREQVLTVPAKSLVPILDGQQVYKIIDGKAYAVNVIIGKRINDKVEILQGLTSQDMVITDGQFKVKNTMPVKVKL